jgi:hypothetical protein
MANVYQARPELKRYPLFALLAWAMALGAFMNGVIAVAVAGPPVIEARAGYWLGLVYLALFASALAFSLYLPVVRKIGPGKAAYSSVLVPIIAMSFSTWFEDYRWTATTIAGAVLALGGMLGALTRGKPAVTGSGRRLKRCAIMPSSVIRRFVYDHSERALWVEFTTGRRYVYSNVPMEVAEAFRGAFAKGAYFNTRIRDCFPYREVKHQEHAGD